MAESCSRPLLLSGVQAKNGKKAGMSKRRRKRSYGSGQVVPPNVPGGPWRIRWREGSRRRRQGGFPTREIAERVLARLAGDAAMGRAGLPRDANDAFTLDVLGEKFLERRHLTHRASRSDKYRWRKHLAPHFGHLKPAEVDAGRIRAFVECKLAERLSAGTIRILVALLSGLYSDLVEQGIAQTNPARSLPRSTRRLFRPTHDPRTTPFIEKLEDVRRIYLDLPKPLDVAYAIGALAGLRTGEVFGLKWGHVDLGSRRIHVRESVSGPLKDKDSRVVPILDALLPVLTEWKLNTGGEGLVIPPLRRDGDHVKISGGHATTGMYLRATLKRLGLARDGLGWYEATRHTFASQWVLSGGSIEKLKEIMGHYSVVVTERYTHLRPDLFAASDLRTIPLSLSPSTSAPTQIGPTLGPPPRIRARMLAEKGRKSRSGPVSRVLFSPN
jgi:integrase